MRTFIGMIIISRNALLLEEVAAGDKFAPRQRYQRKVYESQWGASVVSA